MLISNTCKCLKCGKVYIHFSGGVILKLETPTCPECGSKLFVPWVMSEKKTKD